MMQAFGTGLPVDFIAIAKFVKVDNTKHDQIRIHYGFRYLRCYTSSTQLNVHARLHREPPALHRPLSVRVAELKIVMHEHGGDKFRHLHPADV